MKKIKIVNQLLFNLGIFCIIWALMIIVVSCIIGFSALRILAILMSLFTGMFDILKSIRPEIRSYFDSSGGYHCPPIGINPNGVFCEKCRYSDCSECPNKDLQTEDN